MKLSDFNYNLPKEFIAQKPIYPRDHSRLLILDRKSKSIKHDYFYHLPKYLKKGDVLVFNNTKVFPARLIGKRQETGGRMEIFLLKKYQNQKLKEPKNPARLASQREAGRQTNKKLKIKKGEYWEVLIGNKKKRLGERIIFSKNLFCEIIKQIDQSIWLVRFNKSGSVLEKLIDRLGQVPVPPYIKSRITYHESRIMYHRSSKLKEDYQTVYAKYRGSVAAPTAGFHFTKELLNKLKKAGIQLEFITLHVGFGTFQPVKVNDIKKHKMHVEFAILDKATARRLNQAKKEGRRIVAIGTTTVRALETFLQKSQASSTKLQINSKSQLPKFKIKDQQKWINTFIYPGYKFKFVDAIITNFHLPKSTLLMLISAFAGRKNILRTYEIAKQKKYRFYSFGDVMMIL